MCGFKACPDNKIWQTRDAYDRIFFQKTTYKRVSRKFHPKDGKRLKLTAKVRMEVIRLGMTKFQKALLGVLNGEKRISEELIEKLKG